MKKIVYAVLLATALMTMTGCDQMQKNKKAIEAAMNDSTNSTEGKLVEAPDFRAESLDGETIRLSTFPHKYIVLDFWGTWCKWCVAGIPEMKKYYDKYCDQMEIISVDVDDDEMDLRDFVKEHEMNWTHIINDDTDVDGGLVGLYNVQGYPTKVIIDTEGYIVATYTGETPDFYKKLDELMK